MLQEVAVFPQITYAEGQGFVGTRKWLLDQQDNTVEFLRIVCRSHWPGQPDSVPVSVQSGAFKESVVIMREDANIRTHETLGDLAVLGKTLVVAQYALHRMTNCWPDAIPKPWHPAGTTLTLKIRGSGQFLLVTPASARAAIASAVCTPGTQALNDSLGTRIIIPITEYHIACDRMTREQVNTAFAVRHWDTYQGCVNSVEDPYPLFLGAPQETLLFDGYELTETHACDVDEPNRYCLTACLKHRVIVDADGAVRRDENGYIIGWNHDFTPVSAAGKPTKRWAWTYIGLWDNNRCMPRYRPVIFNRMFGLPDPLNSGTYGDLFAQCECPDTAQTELKDCDLECVSTSDVGSECKQMGSYTPDQASVAEVPLPPSETPPSSSGLPPCAP